MANQTIDTSALGRLSPENLSIISSLIQQMSGGASLNSHALAKPADGIPMWEAKFRQERYAPTTIQMYSYYAGRFLKDNPTPSKLDIQLYLAQKMDGGTTPAATENMRKSIRSLFRFLYEEGLWGTDPTEKIRKIKVPYTSRQCPTPEEVQKVLAVDCYRTLDTDKLNTIIRILATTGLRIGECVSLTKESIDWAALELRIIGKGSKFRVVPLLPSTAEVLKSYIERHPRVSPFVFPGRGPTRHADRGNVETTLRRACLRAGVTPFSPHGLRHFYATEMLKAGAKLEVVGRILGHASIGVTADIYRHVMSGEMHEEHLRFAPSSIMTNGLAPSGNVQ